MKKSEVKKKQPSYCELIRRADGFSEVTQALALGIMGLQWLGGMVCVYGGQLAED